MAKRIEEGALSIIFRQLSLLLAAGVKPAEALESLSEEARDFEAASLRQAAGAVKGGESLVGALKGCEAFPDYAAETAALGEYSGRLEQTLSSLADYYERLAELKKRIKSALLYPSLLLVLMSAVLAVLVFAVLPVFFSVYENLAGSLSASAYSYVAVAGIIARVSLIVTLFVCVLVLGTLAAAKNESGSRFILRLCRRLPALKTAMARLEASRLAG
ncbi:MAG: type II secretion system F family protein, partial [Oscillospiraceae bacterium]|nr:type II secretion system F family protein [Oscillospiraceae bacterium]